MKVAFFGALPAVAFAWCAVAQQPDMTMDAENLLSICTTAHPDAVGFCNGFMQAAHDWPGGDDLRVCAPPGTTRTQLAMLYEQQAPELFAQYPGAGIEREPAIIVARIILVGAFPCD